MYCVDQIGVNWRARLGTPMPNVQDRSNVQVRQLIQLLEEDGWYLVATRGSHRQFKHSSKPGRVTVAGKPSDDLHPKTRTSILRQAGLRP